MIEIVGKELYQWDTGRIFNVTGDEIDHVHFANLGDAKAVIMDLVNDQAKVPDFLFQTGKQLCVYAVKNGITVESKTFYVKHRERPENYVYEDDRRNYIYELVTNAEEALENMREAYQDSTLAIENANLATENANTAAKNAHEASYKANQTAKSLMVVGTVKGESFAVEDAVEQFFVGMRIFGKTTQQGTPTPSTPVALKSVGDRGSVTVNVSGDNDAQTMTIATPNGLPGIPVAANGNYVDINGQQWICDEIDLNRGVYIQYISHQIISNFVPETTSRGTRYLALNLNHKPHTDFTECLCSTLSFSKVVGSDSPYVENGIRVSHEVEGGAIVARYGNVALNGLDVMYIIEPMEIPLSEEEIATYATLHAYRGNTMVSNDAYAPMEIEYAMDAKTYIGNLITDISSPSRFVTLTLPASKWVGSGTLYSQVVPIDGITENSQVNLTPSVEQLAIFYEKDATLMTENDGGVVTVYVIGQKPENDYIIKASIVEVVA